MDNSLGYLTIGNICTINIYPNLHDEIPNLCALIHTGNQPSKIAVLEARNLADAFVECERWILNNYNVSAVDIETDIRPARPGLVIVQEGKEYRIDRITFDRVPRLSVQRDEVIYLLLQHKWPDSTVLTDREVREIIKRDIPKGA
jgi:hypothetical protein